MSRKPTYEELEKRVQRLEKKIEGYEEEGGVGKIREVFQMVAENIDQVVYIMPVDYSKTLYTNAAVNQLASLSRRPMKTPLAG